MTALVHRSVEGAVQAGDAQALVRLLVSSEPDDVIRELGRILGACEIGDVLLLASRLETIEDSVLRELKVGKQLGLLGVREKSLLVTAARAAEARIQVQRELGQLLGSLPEDPGGRVAAGATEPERRRARQDLGISKRELSHLVALGNIEPERFGEYRQAVREGARPPKSVEAIVREVARSGWSSDECYTPAEWIAAARRALKVEQFTCDPMSCLAAQAGLVGAEKWYSLDDERPEPGERESNLAGPLGYGDAELAEAQSRWAGKDGLSKDAYWGNAWWFNPGYAAEVVAAAHDRIREERDAGSAGVVLVNVGAEKPDQQDLLRTCVSAWPRGRIAFWSPTGERMKGNNYAQVMFGPNVDPLAWLAALEQLAVCTTVLKLEACA